jgi:hypothetical protein
MVRFGGLGWVGKVDGGHRGYDDKCKNEDFHGLPAWVVEVDCDYNRR